MTFAALVLLAACKTASPTTETLTDEGTICLVGGDLRVDFLTCLSSSCDTLTSATCEAEMVGDVLEVHAEAVITSEGDECTDDCGAVTADCVVPDGVDLATTQVSYAGATLTAAPCE